MLDYDKNVDGNLAALNKHMAEQDASEKAYEAMMDELQDKIEFDLNVLKEAHDKIVAKHGFETKFIDFVGDIL